MQRVVVPPGAVTRDVVTITDPDELHHLRGVLRVKVGDRLECFDGTGSAYAGRITRCTRRSLVVEIRERFREPVQPVNLTLAQALIKPERFEWVIQKATELGVDRLVPLITERSVVRVASARVEQRLARWRRIAQEAAAQCGRSTLPLLDAPRSVEELLPSLPSGARVLMPTLSAEAVPLKDTLTAWDGAGSVAVLIGPEGDFTPHEVLLAERAGARLVSLGRLTLRSETAAVATLSILQYVLYNSRS
jgi:16S rRNA (uracil1498-N3)-methyltransferase